MFTVRLFSFFEEMTALFAQSFCVYILTNLSFVTLDKVEDAFRKRCRQSKRVSINDTHIGVTLSSVIVFGEHLCDWDARPFSFGLLPRLDGFECCPHPLPIGKGIAITGMRAFLGILCSIWTCFRDYDRVKKSRSPSKWH